MRIEAPPDVWLVGGVRSPFGRLNGVLRDLPLVDLGSQVARRALATLDWPASGLGELDVGVGVVEGGLMVPARQIAAAAGLPDDLPSLTVDRACCSGLTTVGLAARAVAAGLPSALCLGVESMSRTPRLLHGSRDSRVGDLEVEDLLTFHSPLTGTSIAEYVGKVALDHDVDRAAQDEWALGSHRRYHDALDRGYFAGEVVEVETPRGRVGGDEPPRRDTSLEALAALPTVRNSPTITAGNAPGLNDGACAVVVASGDEVERRGTAPLARLAAYLQTAESPTSSAYLPGLAIAALAEHAGLEPDDLDVIEINEAYAATPLVSIRRLAGGDRGLEERLLARTNANGGAVALGHPVGASGARIALTAARRLADEGGRWAAVAVCGGFGQTDAALLERVDA